jgi:hypothetical protein
MRRRDFFKIIAASASIWPDIASAQQSTKVARIGWMSINSPTANDANMTAFRRGMSELGYIPLDGRVRRDPHICHHDHAGGIQCDDGSAARLDAADMGTARS